MLGWAPPIPRTPFSILCVAHLSSDLSDTLDRGGRTGWGRARAGVTLDFYHPAEISSLALPDPTSVLSWRPVPLPRVRARRGLEPSPDRSPRRLNSGTGFGADF